MHHAENKTRPSPPMNYFDNVKNDLNLNTRSRTKEKLDGSLLEASPLSDRLNDISECDRSEIILRYT